MKKFQIGKLVSNIYSGQNKNKANQKWKQNATRKTCVSCKYSLPELNITLLFFQHVGTVTETKNNGKKNGYYSSFLSLNEEYSKGLQNNWLLFLRERKITSTRCVAVILP